MTPELPTRPTITPEDDSRQGLTAWTEEWRAYRNAIRAIVADFLLRHDNALELVAELVEFFPRLETETDTPRKWKLAIVSKGPHEITLRHYSENLERFTLTRTPDGHWTFPDFPTEHPDPTDTAEHIISILLWWGNLKAIYNAKSYLGPASFIPPDDCDSWW